LLGEGLGEGVRLVKKQKEKPKRHEQAKNKINCRRAGGKERFRVRGEVNGDTFREKGRRLHLNGEGGHRGLKSGVEVDRPDSRVHCVNTARQGKRIGLKCMGNVSGIEEEGAVERKNDFCKSTKEGGKDALLRTKGVKAKKDTRTRHTGGDEKMVTVRDCGIILLERGATRNRQQ